MIYRLKLVGILLTFIAFLNVKGQIKVPPDAASAESKELNVKANGFKGIWYECCGPRSDNGEYIYKYSGGMATYTTKHRPLAIYSEKANKTYFCFGGTDDKNSTLLHNVSYFDHATGKVANPTVILDKKTTDAHDNPVISMDDRGYIWIFSTSHGTSRPSYISRSSEPYGIEKFIRINATEIIRRKKQPFSNFSYMQIWYIKDHGFMGIFTRYGVQGGGRVIGFNTSKNGIEWNEWKVIANIEEGHYNVSRENNGKISVAFNYHPNVTKVIGTSLGFDGQGMAGGNWRTNLYYLETTNFGKNWQTASGEKVQLPLTYPENPALVKQFENEGLLSYVKDINYDKKGNPIVLLLSSKGYQSGPQNDPRTWEIFYFNDNKWNNHKITTSGNNYDVGELYIEINGIWRLIAPTEPGRQPYNPGGEVAIWKSTDRGSSWQKEKQITINSPKNHTYVRRPVNAQPAFYAFWADGHARKQSESSLYFCDIDGNVFKLPRKTTDSMITPSLMTFDK